MYLDTVGQIKITKLIQIAKGILANYRKLPASFDCNIQKFYTLEWILIYIKISDEQLQNPIIHNLLLKHNNTYSYTHNAF